jgi:large subunit ribosomal protein L9
MKVILLKDIKGVGRKYEEKEVSDGYATNSLLPKKLAVPASGASGAQIKALKESEAISKQKGNERLEAEIAKLSKTEVQIKARANEKNHLFAAITSQKLSEILKKEKGIDLDPSCIKLDHPIKETGTFEVPVHVSNSKQSNFTLVVIAD